MAKTLINQAILITVLVFASHKIYYVVNTENQQSKGLFLLF